MNSSEIRGMLDYSMSKSKRMNFATIMALGLTSVIAGSAQQNKIMAQKVVEQVKAGHPEISGLEIAASKSDVEGCKTIAATEAAEVGQKCDKDELTAIRTHKPHVDKEKDEFDVTLPIHDSAGKIIATAGMDFKLQPGRTKVSVVAEAQKIAAELEKRFTSKDEIFRPAN
jgi:hypothetical protein